ncbi:hypothetical protein TSOC_015501, partial [Tetrabaena socialis]
DAPCPLDYEEVVKVLLAAGAELEAQDELGLTALHHASRTSKPGHTWMVETLLGAGADVAARDK